MFSDKLKPSRSESVQFKSEKEKIPDSRFYCEKDEDAIVISGISGRFPESDSLQEFEENLFNGVDMITGKV